jgi:hypothetical protein
MLYKAGYEPVLDMKEGRSVIPSGGIEGSDAVGPSKGNRIAPLMA